MPDDIFNTQDQGGTTNALETLVGEGKKYGDNEALAKSRLEADTFIGQLKDEKKQLSDALEAEQKKNGQTATIADLIKEVQKGQNASDDKTNNQGLSEEDFQERVRTIVQGDSDASTKAANREQGNLLVLQKMKGNSDAAKSFIAERAAELGTTPAKLAELSETSPKAFAKLMDVTPSAVPDKGTSLLPNNADNFNNNAAALEIEGTHTKAYFDAKKKEMGVVKYVNNTALQLDYMRSATKLGERF